jgi:soluble lytic murein transglycosylase
MAGVACVLALYAYPINISFAHAALAPQAAKPFEASAPLPPVIIKEPKDVTSLSLVRDGLSAAGKGDVAKADALKKQISSDAARALIEWALLRSENYNAPFSRLRAFLENHRDWPGDRLLRLKTEQALYFGNLPARDVIAYFGDDKPEWPQGRIALALALQKTGKLERAKQLISDAWRNMALTAPQEKEIQSRFPGLITHDDSKYRMDRYLYAEDTKNALRIAQSLGGDDLLIAQARIAVINKAGNAKQLLDAAAVAGNKDAGYLYSEIQWLRREKKYTEAIALLRSAPRDEKTIVDGDAWWVERRLLARAALDLNDAKTAYQIAAEHGSEGELERMEAEFHAGWIALRFLNDPKTADRHFKTLQNDAARPISAARGAYWRARAAESMGKTLEAQNFYRIAAKQPTTYYGLLAQAKLGENTFSLRPMPKASQSTRARFENRDTVRALRWLIALNEDRLVRVFIDDMSKTLKDPQEMGILADIVEDMKDIRFSIQVGKQGLYRNLPLETYAFPTHGLPDIGSSPEVERALALAIARQESVFDPNVKSAAGATGLFQLLPATASAMAKKFHIAWQPKRINEPSYNTQLGVAYLGHLMTDLRGSYILTFAAYNAGPARVQEWIEKFGDPRDPKVDPVDWVERIPFTETRNYVMRVMENLQVYRARMSGNLSASLSIDQDLRRGAKR